MQSAFTRTFHCLWSFPHWTKSSNDLEFPIFRHPKHHMSSLAISPSLYYSPIVLGIIQWSYDIPWIFVFADFAASHHLIGRSDVSQWTAMARCWPVHPTISRSLAGNVRIFPCWQVILTSLDKTNSCTVCTVWYLVVFGGSWCAFFCDFVLFWISRWDYWGKVQGTRLFLGSRNERWKGPRGQNGVVAEAAERI